MQINHKSEVYYCLFPKKIVQNNEIESTKFTAD